MICQLCNDTGIAGLAQISGMRILIGCTCSTVELSMLPGRYRPASQAALSVRPANRVRSAHVGGERLAAGGERLAASGGRRRGPLPPRAIPPCGLGAPPADSWPGWQFAASVCPPADSQPFSPNAASVIRGRDSAGLPVHGEPESPPYRKTVLRLAAWVIDTLASRLRLTAMLLAALACAVGGLLLALLAAGGRRELRSTYDPVGDVVHGAHGYLERVHEAQHRRQFRKKTAAARVWLVVWWVPVVRDFARLWIEADCWRLTDRRLRALGGRSAGRRRRALGWLLSYVLRPAGWIGLGVLLWRWA